MVRKWYRVKCPHCSHEFKHSPEKGFDGWLMCGQCGQKFNVTRLDDYLVEISSIN